MTTATTPADIIKQAYIVTAHAHIMALGLEIGDRCEVNNYFYQDSTGVLDRNSTPLPLGFAKPSSAEVDKSHSAYGSHMTRFRGIDANGDVRVVRGMTEHRLPYSFIVAPAKEEKQRAKLTLNDRYEGVVMGNGTSIMVGCQRFKTEKLRALLVLADKTIAEVAAEVAAKPVAVLSANPTATYVPYVAPPKAAKKVATKKVAKKAPAKKRTAR